MTTDCLVLTPWMQPHQIVSWEESVTLVYLKKGEAIEKYDAVVSSPSISFHIPAVLRLKKMLARIKSDVKFSRINVYTRDGFRCQYCGKKRVMKSLNYDHVVPRSRGGLTIWENIVTCCIPCNLGKDNKTPEEAGMKLIKRPVKPKSLPLSGTFLLPVKVPELWKPYVQQESLDDVG
jgi:5-methylcytosine-specific restriction endonuclease McrA